MAKSDVDILWEEIQRINREIVQKTPKVKRFLEPVKTILGGKILVPYWFPVFEYGRGKRKSTKTSEPSATVGGEELSAFEYNLYQWMKKKGKLTGTIKHQINQVRSLRWYMNKHGNEQYRKGIYKDVYDSILSDDEIDKVVSKVANQAAAAVFSDFLKT